MKEERCRVSFVNGESTWHTSFVRLEINDTFCSDSEGEAALQLALIPERRGGALCPR